jgi:hypothetical protein
MLGGFWRCKIAAVLTGAAFLLTASGFDKTQASQKSPNEVDPPSVEIIELSYVYPKSYEKLKEADFKNFNARFYYSPKELEDSRQLKNGRYSHRGNEGFADIYLDEVDFINRKSDKSMYALVLFQWIYGGGSSNNHGIAQVFELRDRQLTLVQQIEWDQHFDTKKDYSRFERKLGRLIIRSARFLPGDSNCCISAADTVTFQWNGSRFVQVGVQTELSDYGLRNGKKLVN